MLYKDYYVKVFYRFGIEKVAPPAIVFIVGGYMDNWGKKLEKKKRKVDECEHFFFRYRLMCTLKISWNFKKKNFLAT